MQPCSAVMQPHMQQLLKPVPASLQAHGIAIQARRSGSVMSISGMGKWLDRTVSKLMGADVPGGAAGPGSAGELHPSLLCSCEDWHKPAASGCREHNSRGSSMH